MFDTKPNPNRGGERCFSLWGFVSTLKYWSLHAFNTKWNRQIDHASPAAAQYTMQTNISAACFERPLEYMNVLSKLIIHNLSTALFCIVHHIERLVSNAGSSMNTLSWNDLIGHSCGLNGVRLIKSMTAINMEKYVALFRCKSKRG